MLKEYTAHYFFSAIFQGDATIFSILIVFLIFRIQSLESEIQFIKNILYLDNGRNIHQKNVLEFENEKTTKDRKLQILNGLPSIKPMLERWIILEEQAKVWKSVINKSLLPIILNIGLSIFGIVLAEEFNYLGALIGFSIINLLVVGLVCYYFFKV